MIEGYEYTYLLMGVLFFVIWLILFSYRKDNRKAMLVTSFVVAVLGPISNILYMEDWWKPVAIFGPDVALLESLLVAFSVTGIMCVLYEDIFKKRIKYRKARSRKLDNQKLFVLLSSIVVIAFFMFYVMNFNSFIAINAAVLYGIVVILSHRKDLIVESFVSAFLLLIVVVVVYSTLEFLTPGWIDAFWHWKNVPRIIILNVPIDDFVNYLLVGALLGVLYEYWQEGKFVPLAKRVS